MGIKESNLPIAESLGSGDKLRIVTSDGESKQIGADSVGMVAKLYKVYSQEFPQGQWVCTKTYAEMQEYLSNGGANLILQLDDSNGRGMEVHNLYPSRYNNDGTASSIIFSGIYASQQNGAVSSATFYEAIITADEIVVPTKKDVTFA